MKAIKRKDGQWRVQVHSHYEIVDGKKKQIRVSFTAKTKKEALKMGVDFLNSGARRTSLTVADALDGYIKMKNNVLSPTTIISYNQMRKKYFADIEAVKVDKLTNDRVQMWVNALAGEVSAKTVKNIYGFFTASVTAYKPELALKVRLPQKQPIKYLTPSDDEIKAIIDDVKGTELETAVLLAAFGGLRRGEVCALLGSDIVGNNVVINKSMVRAEGGTTVKEPKTPTSNRVVALPEWIIERIKPANDLDRVCNLTPNEITKYFHRVVVKLGLPPYRFHDLRHFASSTALNMGIPEITIQKRFGWSSPAMLRKVYGHSMKDYEEQYTKALNDKITENFK